MPAWDQTGVPIHFHSSTISGSAACISSRTLASVFPRQSPSSLILSSISIEGDFAGTDFSCSAPCFSRGLQLAPEEVREGPKHADPSGPAPRLGTIANGQVRDYSRGEVDGEA